MATAVVSPGLTDRELELRKKYIGASESAAIMGYSPYAHASDVYLSKVMDIQQQPTKMAEMGQLLEPFIIEEAAKELGVETTKANARRRHPDDDAHMQATIDAFIVGQRAIIEAKLTDPFAFKCFQEDPAHKDDKWGESWSDEIPRYYLIQVMHQLHVLRKQTGDAWDTAYLALRIGLNEQRIYVIHYDEAIGQSIEDACRKFWAQHVIPGKPPQDDGPRPETLSRLPRTKGKTVTGLDPTLIPEYEKAHADEKDAADRKETAKAKIIKALGDADCGIDTASRVVRYPLITSTKFDAAAFKASAPQLAAQFTVESSYRRLTISKKG